MTADPSSEPLLINKTKHFRWDVVCCIFLGLLFWIARYWQSAGFGLYEDDLTIIPKAVSMDYATLFRYIGSYISHLYGHGRPLSDSFIYLFSNLGWRLAELKGIYAIGFSLTLINIILFFALVRRVSNRNIALLCSIAYVLYSADTTQVFLTHSLGVQPSITLVLLAFHAYLSNHLLIAYLLAAINLFSYETTYLVFLAAPLLQKRWGRPMVKKFIIHSLILLAILAAVYLLRIQIGEGRVSDLTPLQMLISPITHSLIGPVVSLGTYILRPYQAIMNADPSLSIGYFLLFILFFILLYFLKWDSKIDLKLLVSSLISKSRWKQIPEEIQNLGKLFLAGVVMLLGAYPLTFTVRAYAISGRDTRVHLAGVMGASIVIGCLIALLFILFRNKKLGWVLPLLVSAWFTLLVMYGFVIQQDYRLGWQYQREFWTSLVEIIPDAGPDTVILVDPEGLKDVRQIAANSWNLPRILNQLYAMPEDWKNPPRVFRLIDFWEENLVGSDGSFLINYATVIAPPSLHGEVPADHVIYIDTSSGELIRRDQPLSIGSKSYSLRPIGEPVLTELDRGLLYSLMIIDPESP